MEHITQSAKQLKTARLHVVDALRGSALLGILIVHCSRWFSAAGLPESFYQVHATGPVNSFFVTQTALLFENKFFTFFSFLFGLSFSLLITRSSEAPTMFRQLFTRRLFFLGAIGLLHYLHWRGDILLVYAILGGFLLLLNRLSTKTLLLIATLLLLAIPSKLIHLYVHWETPPTPQERQQEIISFAQKDEINWRTLTYGSYGDTVRENLYLIKDAINFQFGTNRIYKTLGFFLLGLYAGRQQVFQQLKEKQLLWWKYTIGCLLVFFSTKVAIMRLDQLYSYEQQVPELIKHLYQTIYDLRSASLTLFYIGGLTLFFQHRFGQKSVRVFGVVGKMALTNYLLQTLIGSALFFGYGLGLMDKLELWEAIGLSLPIFFFQVVFSKYWMKLFRYGPAEWAWRSLTYGKVQTILRTG